MLPPFSKLFFLYLFQCRPLCKSPGNHTIHFWWRQYHFPKSYITNVRSLTLYPLPYYHLLFLTVMVLLCLASSITYYSLNYMCPTALPNERWRSRQLCLFTGSSPHNKYNLFPLLSRIYPRLLFFSLAFWYFRWSNMLCPQLYILRHYFWIPFVKPTTFWLHAIFIGEPSPMNIE